MSAPGLDQDLKPTRRAHPGAVIALLLIGLLAADSAIADSAELIPADTTDWAQRERDWRPRGLAHIDLPLQLRARYDAADGRWDSQAARLAAAHTTTSGPGLALDQAIESRIALSRPLLGRLELEISWRTRNQLSSSDLVGFGPHVVGALLRFTP